MTTATQFSLDQFIRLYSHVPINSWKPVVEGTDPTCVYVDVTDRFTSEMKWELHHLADYAVSSQSCGVVTLCPRQPDPFISMRSILARFANGEQLTTSINGTRADVRAHYIGKLFELDESQPSVECVSVEFLD